MKQITLYTSTNYGSVQGLDAVYATARSTATDLSTSILRIGQYLSSGDYRVLRSFVKFPTTDIPENAVILKAKMRAQPIVVKTDTEFDVDIIKYDWGAYDPLTTTDIDTVFDGCLAGTKDATLHTFLTTQNIPGSLLFSDDLDTSYISSTDYTYYGLRSSRDFDNETPAFEYADFFTPDDPLTATGSAYRPALIVDYVEMPSPSTNLYYWIDVDWDGTGASTSWENEAGRMLRFALDRGKDRTIGSPGSGFERPNVGKLIVELDNFDGRYDPWNASSPLYGKLKPGRKANFALAYDDTYYQLFTGYVADIRPVGWRQTVTVTIEDGAGWLNSRTPDIPLKSVTDVGAAITAVLDDLEYPYGKNVDAGIDSLDYYWTSGANGLSEIHKLANSDLGRFCIQSDGVARFYNRHDASSVARTLTEDQIGKDIYLNMPWDYTRNAVDVYVYPLLLGSTDTTLWTLRDAPNISAGDTLTLWGEYNYEYQSVPGTGVYLSSFEPSASLATTDIALTAFSRDVRMDITNTTTDTVSMTELIIKGTPIYSPDAIKLREEETAESFPATFVMNYPWLTNINTGQSFAESLLNFLNDAKEYPEIWIYNRPDIACEIELEERLRLVIDTWGIDETFFVNKISHTSGVSTQEIISTIKLYPMLQDIGTDTLILSSTDLGILDTNKLGY